LMVPLSDIKLLLEIYQRLSHSWDISVCTSSSQKIYGGRA